MVMVPQLVFMAAVYVLAGSIDIAGALGKDCFFTAGGLSSVHVAPPDDADESEPPPRTSCQIPAAAITITAAIPKNRREPMSRWRFSAWAWASLAASRFW